MLPRMRRFAMPRCRLSGRGTGSRIFGVLSVLSLALPVGAAGTWSLHGALAGRSGEFSGTLFVDANAWTNLSAADWGGYSPRSGVASATDEAVSHGGLLYGGQDAASAVLNQTWFTDDQTIREMPTVGPPPPGLVAANLVSEPAVSAPAATTGAAAYVPASGMVVLFGGSASADTWGFDGSNWTRLSSGSAAGPPARANATLMYNPGGPYLFLFGGNPSSGRGW